MERQKKKRISNWQWFRISHDVLDDGYSLKAWCELYHCKPRSIRRQVRLQQEALWVSLGSSACTIESLVWVLCVYPITQAGRKFKGKYIFYAVQSKLILSLSQLFAPVSIKCLRRAWLLRNLSSKGDGGGGCQG